MARASDVWIMPHIKTQGLSLSHPKILDADALSTELMCLRAVQKQLRIVFTNGCYDILHPGHVDLLSRAKLLGDVLVLALNSDDSVRSLGKGADRPVNSLEVRSFMAAHLSSVDYVTSFDESTPLEIVKLLKPQVLVKGGDWAKEDIVGSDVVEGYGGLVVSLPLLCEFSTTKFIEDIRK